MTQATGPGGTVTHTYDGDGLKRQRVGPDGTRRYYYDGIRPLWEADGAGVMTTQYDRDIFGNLLSRREASGARRYYHFDGLGSTTALTNESGAATSTLLYDAWGNQRAASGSDQGRYRFTGAELDAATGLYHMGARFYDPTLGRWLSEDPVQDEYFRPMTLNFYTYVHSNPLNLTDPTGTTACDNACIERLNRERQDFVKQLLEIMKNAPSTVAAFVQDFLKSLERLPAASAAQASAWAASVLSGLSLGALIAGQDSLAQGLAWGSIAATGASWYFTARLYAQGDIPPMAYFVSQAFNVAGAFLTAAGLPARDITRPGMTTAAALAAAAAFLARPVTWAGLPLAYFRWR